MRIVFVGASDVALQTAELLIQRGHEVVIIESDEEKIDELSEEMDCSFLKGDGSHPQILDEAGPEQTDILFCLTDSDQNNILASLVGKSLGFGRVITAIRDSNFENICTRLGLEDVIIPTQTIGRYLADITQGEDIFEISTLIKGEARLFSFIAEKADAGDISELDLPAESRVVCYYRDDKFILYTHHDEKLQKGDEVVILTHSKNLETFRKRWQSKQVDDIQNR